MISKSITKKKTLETVNQELLNSLKENDVETANTVKDLAKAIKIIQK